MALHPQTTLPEDRLNVGGGALRPYLRAIREHLLLVALVVLVALGAGIAFVTLRSPRYEATAELLISPLPQDDTTFRGLSLIRDTGDPARTAQTATALIDDPDQAARIANQFASSALEARRRALVTEVDAAIAGLRAQRNGLPSGSPVKVDLGRQLSRLRPLSGGEDPTLAFSQRAVPPRSPAGVPAPLVVVLSLLAGLTIGAGAALLLELVDRRIRDEEDLVRLASPPTLTRVPKLSRLDASNGSVLSLITSQSKLADVLVSSPELPGVQLLLAPTNTDHAFAEWLPPAISRWLPGILADAKALADYVIIDTAPLGEVADALRIATQVDEVLLVAQLGHTRQDGLRTTLELLDHASCRVAGLIVIGSKVTIGAYGYYARHPAGVRPRAAGAGAQGWRGYSPPNPAGEARSPAPEGSTDGEPAAGASR